ncbi:MAG: STAS domain-containing protein [Verrucomicrobia bacterium]|nr:STAS domain-containing protein [Verrucomicrobiota bacterium]MCF7708146.1 STAS domain-containing protein [Verrucomicrobiota bacterium]
MSLAGAQLGVAVAESKVLVKIIGRANFAVSVDFKSLIRSMVSRGYGYFVIDLSECLIMDSTFSGVLAALTRGQSDSERTDRQRIEFELVKPNERIRNLLENLGVLELFKVSDQLPFKVDTTNLNTQQESRPSREELSRTSLDAHKTLMELYSDNIPKFKDVTKFLEEDLKKRESESENSTGE